MRVLAALALLVLAAGVAAAVAFVDQPRDIAGAWLVAWAWCFTIAVGALGTDLLLEACGARWQVAIRRPLEALHAPLAALALLAVPIGLAARALYPWADRPVVMGWWWLRSVAYLLALVLIRRLTRVERADRRRGWSCAALPAYALALTGGSWDWFMSTAPGFNSTVYPAWIWASGVLAATAAWTVLVVARQPRARLPIRVDHLVALGRLLLAFVIFAAYLSFSQLIVAWMADLPREAAWYRPRLDPPWGVVGAAVAIGAYGLPFAALLSLALKRWPLALALTAAWIVAWHYVDLAWWLAPSLSPERIPFHWSHLAAVVAVAGCYAAGVAWSLARGPALPEDDARLARSLAYSAEIAG